MVEDQIIAVPGLFEKPKIKQDLNEEADETHKSGQNGGIAGNDRKHQSDEKGESGENGERSKNSEKCQISEICEDGSSGGGNQGDQGDKKPQSAEPFKSSWRKLHRTYLMIFSAVVGAFYGTIHSTKWNSVWFPTVAEHRLWHISCVLGSAAVVPITILLLNPFAPKHLRPLGKAVGVVCWVFFVAARVYIIVESFLSLRSLPLDAFEAVRWANAIPHI
ncbi:hypothetical protein K440DRAFT_620449 [Wilcoxina mikolae CBS 423.85]|nr:hypothetical protein K440DRAFT_620449 [Wilcoxina mikolae CBS 423.85]